MQVPTREVRQQACGGYLFAAILFTIGHLPFSIFHLSFSAENEN
jgi:hypothetical protein